ncbi:hypothetical protein WKT22_02136 [Candidatus Lokiarchaeum ossiferum]
MIISKIFLDLLQNMLYSIIYMLLDENKQVYLTFYVISTRQFQYPTNISIFYNIEKRTQTKGRKLHLLESMISYC